MSLTVAVKEDTKVSWCRSVGVPPGRCKREGMFYFAGVRVLGDTEHEIDPIVRRSGYIGAYEWAPSLQGPWCLVPALTV